MVRLPHMESYSKIKKDEAIYNRDSLYPDTWYDYNIGVGIDNNEHVTFLSIYIYPVRYNPVQNIIKYASNIDIRISYRLPSVSFSSENKYDLLIIAPSMFSKSLQPLVDHKENKGIKTKVVSTEWIYLKNILKGRDKQEKIKYFIKDAIENWGIKYVLLVGGIKGQRFWSWYVPVRYSNLDDASNWETSYISDLYYADIYKYSEVKGYTFDDWDSNGNGIFAEWNNQSKDILDMYPDIYIGRLPCRYLSDVKNVVERIINYEDTTYGKEWFNRMAVIGGDSFDDMSWNTSTDFLEGQVEADHALSFMPDFEHTRIYVEGGDVELTTENIITELSKGHGFVYFSGHGNPSSWATHPHGDFETWIDFGTKSIKKLENHDKLPVLIVGGCHNCQFDVSLLSILKKGKWAYYLGEFTPKCWGWLFASKPDGGSIATIGNTGLGYGTIGDGPDPPDEIPDSKPDGIPDCIQYLDGWLEPHFFNVYNQSIDILGEIYSKSLTDYLNNFPINWIMDWKDHENYSTLVDCKTVQEWVLFGDPSLKLGGY